MEDKNNYTLSEIEKMFEAYCKYRNAKEIYEFGECGNNILRERVNLSFSLCEEIIPKSLINKLEIKK